MTTNSTAAGDAQPLSGRKGDPTTARDAGPTQVHVADPTRPYDVLIGTGVLSALADVVGAGVARVAVVHPRSCADLAAQVCAQLGSSGFRVTAIEVPDGEAAKTLDVAASCWSALGDAGFTRTDAVVGVGGGSVTDLAGFVAATWLRGVRVVHVPTTLAAMVDAAIGGKTGVNTPHGKNLVGAFFAPAGVLCDLDTLATLGRRDLVSGLAEVVKCGFIADPAILGLVEGDPRAAETTGSPVMRDLVERAVRVKAAVVAVDPTEQETPAADGVGRAALNYGHTLAHAIEKRERFRWRHGDAVAVGLVYAAELSRLAGLLDAGTASRHREILAALDLPTTYGSAAWPELLAAMRMDKKTRGDRLRFVVLDGLGHPAILDGPPDELLAEAYAAVARD